MALETSAPPAARLLDAWEAGAGRPPAWRALALLAAAHPEAGQADLLGWPVGRRDRELLGLRTALFGPQLAGLAGCPRCGERLDIAFPAADVTAPGPPDEPEPEIAWAGRRLRFRLPNAGDLLALARCRDLDEARGLLLARCSRDTGPAEIDTLPEALLQELARRMAEADPQADVYLALTCAVCGHAWTVTFDIAAYLWAEVDAWAQRTLQEVHRLAGAYGWSESEILALSPARRRRYLDLVASGGA